MHIIIHLIIHREKIHLIYVQTIKKHIYKQKYDTKNNV